MAPRLGKGKKGSHHAGRPRPSSEVRRKMTAGGVAAQKKEWASADVHRPCPDGQVLQSCEPVRFRCCLRSLRTTTVMAAQIRRSQNEILLESTRKQAKTLASRGLRE